MNIDEDTIQRLKVGALFLLQIYKVSTGTLLSLFVPQSCGDRICTLQENYENEEPYHKSLLYFQMFSWVTFFVYYIYELRREEWAIKYLDIDNNKADNSLKEIIKTEPILDKRMDSINKNYFRLLVFNCSVYLINVMATIKLLNDSYHSMSTMSCFASFTLLVCIKLYNSIIVAYESVKNDKMMSAYMCEFVSFNVLDSDYLEAKQKSLPDIELSSFQEEELRIPERDYQHADASLEDITPVIRENQ